MVPILLNAPKEALVLSFPTIVGPGLVENSCICDGYINSI